jgi:pimeloyl-ACP methyl ester carboxylesterase
MFPGRVVGVVFVDANHEDDLLGINGTLQRQWETASGQPIPLPKSSGPLRLEDIPAEARGQIQAAAQQANSQHNAPPYNKLPEWAREARMWSWSQTKHFAANSSPFDGDEALALRNERSKIPRPLGDLPLVVLTRGRAVTGPRALEREAERKQHQAALVTLSTQGRQVVAVNSGHHIQIDEPELVVQAIRDVVSKVASPR